MSNADPGLTTPRIDGSNLEVNLPGTTQEVKQFPGKAVGELRDINTITKGEKNKLGLDLKGKQDYGKGVSAELATKPINTEDEDEAAKRAREEAAKRAREEAAKRAREEAAAVREAEKARQDAVAEEARQKAAAVRAAEKARQDAEAEKVRQQIAAKVAAEKEAAEARQKALDEKIKREQQIAAERAKKDAGS